MGALSLEHGNIGELQVYDLRKIEIPLDSRFVNNNHLLKNYQTGNHPETISQKKMAHFKKIMSLDWHPTQSNILATSGLDNYVKVWDMNDTTKEIMGFMNIEPITCIKWLK